MEYLIQQFLAQNSLTGINGINYSLRDDGEGVYIDKWVYNIPKPVFTQEDFDGASLQKAKTAKITQLKLNRDTHNLAPMVAVQANEITFDESGFDVITDKKVYFKFNVSPTGQPASEPNSIILRQGQAKNPDSYLRYSCAIVEENLVRKGYVAINKAVALTLDEHIAERYTNAIKYTNDIEDEINACTTIEEVNAINITFE